MELTGAGDRTTHDVGEYDEIESIVALGVTGDLNCRTSGKYC